MRDEVYGPVSRLSDPLKGWYAEYIEVRAKTRTASSASTATDVRMRRAMTHKETIHSSGCPESRLLTVRFALTTSALFNLSTAAVFRFCCVNWPIFWANCRPLKCDYTWNLPKGRSPRAGQRSDFTRMRKTLVYLWKNSAALKFLQSTQRKIYISWISAETARFTGLIAFVEKIV